MAILERAGLDRIERVENYLRQNGVERRRATFLANGESLGEVDLDTLPLTPAQRRRIRAKFNADAFGTAGKGRLRKRFESQQRKSLRTSVANALGLVKTLRRFGGPQNLAEYRAAQVQMEQQLAAARKAAEQPDEQEQS